METVEKIRPKALARVKRADGARAATPRRTRGRAPSEATLRAHEALAQLEPFFATKTDLARALGWTAPTLRQWLESRPARPRQDTIRSVMQLRDLAVAAGKWVSNPQQVGEWLLSPHPQLRGAVPAEMARSLPAEGVELLVDDMALIAPQERAKPGSAAMSLDLLRETLRQLRAPAIRSVDPIGEADLSDFD